jgi:iron complex transport system substrate-binding protein
MPHRKAWSFAGLVVALATLVDAGAAAAQDAATRRVTDSAGRSMGIPRRVTRVLASGPPASILLYTLAPEKMVGWVRTPRPAEKGFLADAVRQLPEYGRLTGRGNTANLENVLRFNFPESLRDSTRQFYKLFYHVDLTEPRIDRLLAPAIAAKPEK